MSKVTDEKDVLCLDRILTEEVGQRGWYQFRAFLLCAIVAILTGETAYAYLFTVVKVKTRCVIPECENSSAPAFSPPWILDAVPPSGDSFDSCNRYSPIAEPRDTDSCSANLFDKNTTIKCEEYVYEHQNSAYYEFSLACDNWRPTLVGSVATLGYMLCLPMTGFVADRWGRRVAVALNAFNSAWIGCLNYFATSYNSFLLLNFAGSLFGACSFPSAYILAVEYMGPKYRVVAGVSMSSALAVGETLVGLIAWAEPYWRNLVLIVSAPSLLFVTYFWIAPESVRWLMSKGRYNESLAILQNAAAMNGNSLSESTTKGFLDAKDFKKKEKDTDTWLVCLVFRHTTVLLRCLIMPICWISCIFLYYGLTISSVGISGNRYLNYSTSTAIQIPGYWIAMLLLDRVGRKPVVFGGFVISAACQFAYIFISRGSYLLSLSIYLLGKMCISGVVTSLYVYTAELFPTQYRTSLFAFCSMIGRVGGIIAPLMPGLAAEVWEQLPFALFGGMALLSGLLVLLAPETLGKTLPDTMEEAENLGKGTRNGILQRLRALVFRSKTYTVK